MSKDKIDYGNGIIAGIIAQCLTLPLDFVKVQQQKIATGQQVEVVRGHPILREAISKAGFPGVFKGIEAAAARAVVNQAMRGNIYCSVIIGLSEKDRYHSVPMAKKSFYSGITAASVAIACNPLDLALIRVQSRNYLPPESMPFYSNILGTVGHIAKEEGFGRLFRGAYANALKNFFFAFTVMSTFDQVREFYARILGDISFIREASIMTAAMVGGFFAMPFDNIKTKMQTELPTNGNTYYYKGIIDTFSKASGREGFFGLYVGNWSMWARNSFSMIMITYLVEYLRGMSQH